MTTSPPADRISPPLVAVEEAADLFPQEWILMKVTAFDEERNPTLGCIVAHDASNSKVMRKLCRIFSAEPKSEDFYYAFQGYHHLRTGDEVKQALADAADIGAAGAWRRW